MNQPICNRYSNSRRFAMSPVHRRPTIVDTPERPRSRRAGTSTAGILPARLPATDGLRIFFDSARPPRGAAATGTAGILPACSNARSTAHRAVAHREPGMPAIPLRRFVAPSSSLPSTIWLRAVVSATLTPLSGVGCSDSAPVTDTETRNCFPPGGVQRCPPS
jgi:hypothetical protein